TGDMSISANGTLSIDTASTTYPAQANNVYDLPTVNGTTSYTLVSDITAGDSIMELSNPLPSSTYLVNMDISMANTVGNQHATIKYVSSLYGDAGGSLNAAINDGILYD